MIDLRSDTITRPTPAMRKAMAYAEVGGAAALSGVSCRMIIGERGIFTGEDVITAVRPWNIHYPVARLVVIENTHNKGGGSIWPIETIADVERTARRHNLRMHMDGARLWHASVATGIPEREYARHFDSVSVCFSKGLGAPIGSALAGDQAYIERAERFRKQFGGGMRQAGIIAAGAIFALDHQRARLAEDHENARRLAEGIANMAGLEIDLSTVETNIVIFRTGNRSAPETAQKFLSEGLYVMATAKDTIRAVTHIDVTREDIDRALDIVARVVRDK